MYVHMHKGAPNPNAQIVSVLSTCGLLLLKGAVYVMGRQLGARTFFLEEFGILFSLADHMQVQLYTLVVISCTYFKLIKPVLPISPNSYWNDCIFSLFVWQHMHNSYCNSTQLNVFSHLAVVLPRKSDFLQISHWKCYESDALHDSEPMCLS